MANITTLFGFRHKNTMNPSTVPYVKECPVTVNTYIYPGDLVKYGTPPYVSVVSNAVTVPYGVAISYGTGYVADLTVGSTLNNNVLVIPLADNPNYVFEARVGNTANIGQNDVGSFIAATIAAGNSVLRQSRQGLDGSTVDATQGALNTGAWWRIVGIPTDPQNETDGTYTRLYVTIAPPLGDTTAGLIKSTIAAS